MGWVDEAGAQRVQDLRVTSSKLQQGRLDRTEIQWLGRDEPVLRLQIGAQFPCWRAGLRAGSLPICDWRLSQPFYFSFFFYTFLHPSPLRTSFTSQSPSAPYPCSQHINLPSLLLSHSAVLSTCHCTLLIILCILHWFLLPASLSSPAPVISRNLYPHPTPSLPSSTSCISFLSPPYFSPSSFSFFSFSPSCLYISTFPFHSVKFNISFFLTF